MSTLAGADPGFASGFQRDGFAVLGGFLERRELRPLRAEVEAILGGPLAAGCKRPHNTLAPLRWSDRIVQCVLDCPRRQAAIDEAIGSGDLRWISAYISVKEPTSAALWWHQDWWCWSHPVTYRRAPSQVAVLCYLAESTAHTAALRVLPGTHHRSGALHSALPEAHAREASGLDDAHVAMRDHPGQVTLAARAGDAVVIDYRLLHGTHPNRGGARRDCLVFNFTPSWRDLPADIRAHLIRHPALPTRGETQPASSWAKLLPSYDGPRRDLPLNRVAPGEFEMLD